MSNVPDLVGNFMARCTMLEKKRIPDGQGGFTSGWADAGPFLAAVVKDNTLAARVADKQGVTEVYTVTTPPGVGLEYHDVFRRDSDGAIFRVTSNSIDSKPPASATFAFEQVTAERWELTT